jgi:hypothetical protein
MTARIVPAAIITSPIPVAIYGWFPFAIDGFAKFSIAASSAFAVGFALSQAVRELGNRAEDRLLQKWGGWPSTLILRHGDQTIDAATKVVYHRRLVEMGAVDHMPTQDEEGADPAAADAAYAAAANWLRTKTRDTKKFSLVFSENINYGFRRNLLGCKLAGIALATIVGCADSVALYHGKSAGLAGIECLVVLIYLVAFVTPSSVRAVAFDYAKRLVETINAMEAQKSAAPRPRKKKVVGDPSLVG